MKWSFKREEDREETYGPWGGCKDWDEWLISSELTFDLQRTCLLESFCSMNINRTSCVGRGCRCRSSDGSLTIRTCMPCRVAFSRHFWFLTNIAATFVKRGFLLRSHGYRYVTTNSNNAVLRISLSHFGQMLCLVSAAAKQRVSLLSYNHDSTSNLDSISTHCSSRQPTDRLMRSAVLTAPSSLSQHANVSHQTDDDPTGIRSTLKVRCTVSNLSVNLCFHDESLPQIS